MSARTTKILIFIISSVSGAMSVPLLSGASTPVLLGTGLSALSASLLSVLVPAPGTAAKLEQASLRPPPFKETRHK